MANSQQPPNFRSENNLIMIIIRLVYQVNDIIEHDDHTFNQETQKSDKSFKKILFPSLYR